MLDSLGEVLGEASRLRLRSDVPVSMLLSGGSDSGLVSSYLVEAGARDAVTVGFPGAAEDERVLTRATAKAFGIELREEELRADLPGRAHEPDERHAILSADRRQSTIAS